MLSTPRTDDWTQAIPGWTEVVLVARLFFAGTLLIVGIRVALSSLSETLWSKRDEMSRLSGPWGLPFVGYMPFLGSHPHKTLAHLARRYGDVFRLTAGCRRFVVVNSVAKIREMAQRFPEELYGKPKTFTTEQLTVGAHNDMLKRWKKRRAYTNAGLKNLERYCIKDVIEEEVSNMIEFVDTISASGQPARDVRHDLSYFVSRVLYRVSYGGHPDEVASNTLRKIVHAMPDYTTTIGSFSPFDLIPCLRHFLKDRFQKFVEFNRFMSRFCRAEKIKCLQTLREKPEATDELGREPSSDLFHFFQRKWDQMSDADQAKFSLTDDVLYDGLEDIIRAGTESSSLLIHWFLLYIASFPHVQSKMQEEIDEYMSTRRPIDLPRVDDLVNLPYCQAVLIETYRFCSLNPFLKRELTADIEVDGLRLPRGTVILFNNWAINNDPQQWNSPELFLPERFLLPNGSIDAVKADNFIPFGFGKRKCIGVFTGKSLCALAAVCTIYKFDVRLDSDSKPDLEAVFGIGLSPKEYKVVFRRRQTDEESTKSC